MTIQQSDISRIIVELESNPEPNLTISQLIAVAKYLEKEKKTAAKKGINETYIDGIRLVF
jgi:hypothetical protein